MSEKLDNIYSKIIFFVLIICLVFVFRILFLNIVKGEEYRNVANNSIYKKIIKVAPRGEIRDRNGILLAGNKPIFTVQITKNQIKDSDELNKVSIKLYDILHDNKENIIDNFPIKIENNSYSYSYDEDVLNFKKNYGIPEEYSAEDSFFFIVNQAEKNIGLDIDEKEDIYKIQKVLNDNGIYPPISVGNEVEFTSVLEKQQFLYGYQITDKKIDAKEAFKKIRKNQNIPSDFSDEEARKILVISDAIKSKGYLQYEPATIAKDISQTTVSIINEEIVNLPGVSVEIEPLRYYPQGNFASHILGQIGKISDHDTFLLDDERYTKSDYVGKSGIENAFESDLKGVNGYETVMTDARGNTIKELDKKEPIPGNTVYLSIDAYLQKVAEDSLKNTLDQVRTGSTIKSKWGDYKIKTPYPNAISGATVVLDVKTGKVLAMTSYPGYDPNIFISGLTKQQFNSLQPSNPNDPLAAKPQFNVATMTTVQPGSIFKMITGLAALEEGLNENYIIEDKGVIEIGGRNFGTFMWNQYKKLQGPQDMVSALKDSNNYYFYCISSGYDYSKDKEIPGLKNMGEEQIIRMAKKFGLDQKTGIEIYEVKGSTPDKQKEYDLTKKALYNDIKNQMENSFNDINSDNKLYEDRINQIIGWMDENPERWEIIERLKKLNVKTNKLDYLADRLKYTYFNSATWTVGDIFNISIGQGGQTYTPLQMANYVSSLSNGGKLNKVSLIDRIHNLETNEDQKFLPESTNIELKDYNHFNPIKRGMLEVSRNGSAKVVFGDFPVDVASKTGTAEKEGYIPTKNEEKYLISHMDSYGVNKDEVLKLANSMSKEDSAQHKFYIYMREAIKKINKNMTDDKIDKFKDTYDPFGWCVAFAPYDNPEIAVCTILFQGGSGTLACFPTREVIAEYMGLNEEKPVLNEETTNREVKVEQTEENQEKIYDYEIPTYEGVNNYHEPIYTPPAKSEMPPILATTNKEKEENADENVEDMEDIENTPPPDDEVETNIETPSPPENNIEENAPSVDYQEEETMPIQNVEENNSEEESSPIF